MVNQTCNLTSFSLPKILSKIMKRQKITWKSLANRKYGFCIPNKLVQQQAQLTWKCLEPFTNLCYNQPWNKYYFSAAIWSEAEAKFFTTLFNKKYLLLKTCTSALSNIYQQEKNKEKTKFYRVIQRRSCLPYQYLKTVSTKNDLPPSLSNLPIFPGI